MATYGVLGDIHGNVEALQAVLEELDARRVRRILCVGDVIGYNADPDRCVELLARRGADTIAGNHDLIGTGRLGFQRCANNARYSLARTRRKLAPRSAAWLNTLPANRVVEGTLALVHGGVRDVQLYMKTAQQIARNAELLRIDFPGVRVCFFGHSHDQKLYEVGDEGVRDLPVPGLHQLSAGRLYFINAGSVDAQRKRENRRAEFALFDSDAWTVEFLSCRYDAAATEAKAAAAGYRITPFTNWLYTQRRRVFPAF